jgi:resuscitation-promoting factor RpfB
MRRSLLLALVCASSALVVLPDSTAQAKGKCHKAYVECVPIASDVDCANGSGNGPEYVDGPITVKKIGKDPYRLDADKDGIGCE